MLITKDGNRVGDKRKIQYVVVKDGKRKKVYNIWDVDNLLISG